MAGQFPAHRKARSLPAGEVAAVADREVGKKGCRCTGVAGGHVCVCVCTYTCVPTQHGSARLGAGHPVFLMHRIPCKQTQASHPLKLFPNTSDGLEQIVIFQQGRQWNGRTQCAFDSSPGCHQ